MLGDAQVFFLYHKTISHWVCLKIWYCTSKLVNDHLQYFQIFSLLNGHLEGISHLQTDPEVFSQWKISNITTYRDLFVLHGLLPWQNARVWGLVQLGLVGGLFLGLFFDGSDGNPLSSMMFLCSVVVFMYMFNYVYIMVIFHSKRLNWRNNNLVGGLEHEFYFCIDWE